MPGELNQFRLNFRLPHEVEPSQGDFSIQIEVTDILIPVIDGHAVHLVGLEYHRIAIFTPNYHGNVIEIAVGQHSLHLGSEMVGVKQQNIASFNRPHKIPFRKDVLMNVGKFAHSFKHQFLRIILIAEDTLERLSPQISVLFCFTFEDEILALAGEVQNEALGCGVELYFEEF